MVYRLSVMNIAALVLIICSLGWLVINYKQLAEDEGWGAIAMIAFAFFGVTGIVLDFFLQILIKKRLLLNIIESVAVIIFALWTFPDLF